MIKVLSPAQKHLQNRTLPEFHNYWGESHGPLFANTKLLRRYVQHLTMPEAYGGTPDPTYDGCSLFWYDSVDSLRNPLQAPEDVALREEVGKDDRQLFDRSSGWPTHARRGSIVAEEKVVLDGPTTPGMVKALFIAGKLPGLMHQEFFDHWYNHHGLVLGRKLPGLRRYVQNHAILDAMNIRGMTHDGWSEVWFDDLESFYRAHQSLEWDAMREDGRTLFATPMGIGIAREKVQKWDDWKYNDWGAANAAEDEIRTRLQKEGFKSLVADPQAPAKIKKAAQNGRLAVWTWEHLVTIDDSRIDARPEK